MAEAPTAGAIRGVAVASPRAAAIPEAVVATPAEATWTLNAELS